MASPPSPVKQVTGWSVRWAAAMAAGSEKPIDDRPFVISRRRGPDGRHPCPSNNLCEPTSTVAIPSGSTSCATRITSEGFIAPAVRPESNSAASASRCAAISASGHPTASGTASASSARIGPIGPTTSASAA